MNNLKFFSPMSCFLVIGSKPFVVTAKKRSLVSLLAATTVSCPRKDQKKRLKKLFFISSTFSTSLATAENTKYLSIMRNERDVRNDN